MPEGALPIVMFLTLVALFFTGFPIAFILGGVAIGFGFLGWLLGEFRMVQFFSLAPRIWGGIAENVSLVSIPMFIFMGAVLERSGIGDDLLRCLQIMLRRVPGGMMLAVTILGTIMAATTGIVGASVVMLTLLALPIMLQQRYSPALATGTIAASGTLGILIPPSIMLVFMADMLSTSAVTLFVAAALPGLLLSGLYLLFILIVCTIRPELAPPLVPDPKAPAGLDFVWFMVKSFVPPTVLVALVLGSIFFGYATVTESAGVGAAGALLLAAAKGRLGAGRLAGILDQSLRVNAMVFMVLLGATAFAYVFRILGGDHVIVNWIENLGLGPWGVLGVVMLAIFIMGFFFDWLEIVLIVLPIIAPALKLLDFGGHVAPGDDLTTWFAILVAVNLQTSFLTPPVGFAIIYLAGAAPAGVTNADIYRGIIPFVLLQLVGLSAVLAFPELALWLPRQLFG